MCNTCSANHLPYKNMSSLLSQRDQVLGIVVVEVLDGLREELLLSTEPIFSVHMHDLCRVSQHHVSTL